MGCGATSTAPAASPSSAPVVVIPDETSQIQAIPPAGADVIHANILVIAAQYQYYYLLVRILSNSSYLWVLVSSGPVACSG